MKKSRQEDKTRRRPRKAGTGARAAWKDGAGRRYNHLIFRDWCKKCGICSAFCPKKVIGRDNSGAPVIERPEDCIGCRFCEEHCPDFAITIQEEETRENP